MRTLTSIAALAAVLLGLGRHAAATVPDERLACAADSVASVEIRRPSIRDQGPAAALRQALQQRIGALSLPLPAGEQCTQRVDVDVTAGKQQANLLLRTRNPSGAKDSDSIKLRCLAQAP
jgi:hypothetical protein